MSKRGIIIGGGLVVLLGVGCLGLTTLGGVGAWFALSAKPLSAEDQLHDYVGDHFVPAVVAEPTVVLPVPAGFDIYAEGTEADTDVDTDSDTATVETVTTGSATPTPRPRRTTSPTPRSFSEPEAVEAPVPEEENLDDIDLERTAIQVIDEELTPRERRRLRREERD